MAIFLSNLAARIPPSLFRGLVPVMLVNFLLHIGGILSFLLWKLVTDTLFFFIGC